MGTIPTPDHARSVFSGDGPRASATILLVDDEAKIRKVLSLGLQARGFTVVEAADGHEALRIVREHKGKLDLLLVDVVMPGMTGLELAPLALTIRPEMKVILMSGYRNEQLFLNAALNPNTPFFHKPFTIESLVATIRALLTPDK